MKKQPPQTAFSFPLGLRFLLSVLPLTSLGACASTSENTSSLDTPEVGQDDSISPLSESSERAIEASLDWILERAASGTNPPSGPHGESGSSSS